MDVADDSDATTRMRQVRQLHAVSESLQLAVDVLTARDQLATDSASLGLSRGQQLTLQCYYVTICCFEHFHASNCLTGH